MGAPSVGGGDSFGGYRTRLVNELQAKGIRDLAVLRAVSQVPRHLFVPESVRHRAYEDSALPLSSGQTISQPWVQARCIELLSLSGRERVLEVGTGSGYQTALMALCGEVVFTIERIPALAQQARTILSQLGMSNISYLVGDGTLGWRAFGPYNAIVVAAGSPEIPAPLLEQLAPGGRLVAPVGTRDQQILTFVRRDASGSLHQTTVSDVRFVPLIGQFGHGTDSPS
ncbi:MAG: protein-L-isoaspartate(D-aspartate) O-methyltransferase [Gemmatimonadales bacterium]|nr:MAG: protein-L-isoaspartate(D-aspartate) O-methyltransferase [Gemmatimonadales bacterium]